MAADGISPYILFKKQAGSDGCARRLGQMILPCGIILELF